MRSFAPIIAWTLLVDSACVIVADAQGPASCGFHLDLLTAGTSTHSSIADMPGAVGSFAPIPAGAPGNPYTAWALPGTPFRITLSVPAGTLGPIPFGAGSPVSILWSFGAPLVPIALGPAFVPTCAGVPHVIGVLPIGGAIVDGAGILGPPPIIATADPGFPSRFSVTLVYPAFPLPPVTFQAVVATGVGFFGISNAVTVIGGVNPAEFSLVPGLLPSGGPPPLDDGQAVGVPTPLAFDFYGVPSPFVDVDTNGFLDFCPGAATCGGADVGSDSVGAGCPFGSPVVRPRINVNHFNIDLGVPPPAPALPDITVELAPGGPFWPDRTIIRWKNVMPFGAVPGSGLASTFVAELWGDSRIAIVRQGSMLGPVGIGPGDIGQGYGGPSPLGASTCLLPGGISFSTLWGFPPYFGGFAGVIEEDAAIFHLALGNLAVVFTPAFPGAYMASVL